MMGAMKVSSVLRAIFNVTLNKFLVIVLLFVVIIIGVTTFYWTSSKKAAPQTNTNELTFQNKYDEMGLDRIRTVSSPDANGNTTTIVVTPYLYYKKGDTEFLEELHKKSLELKRIFKDYFPQYTVMQIREAGEMSIKKQLQDTINSTLVLGKVEEINFFEYIFLGE